MTRPLLTTLAASLLVAGIAAPLRAEKLPEDTQAQLTELYKKMSLLLLGGEAGARSMMVLANPGLSISDGFSETKTADNEILDAIVDVAPQPQAVFAKSTSTLSGVWKDILDNRHPVNPPQELSPAEKEEIQAIAAHIAPGSAATKAYETGADNYYDALANLEDARAAAAASGTAVSSTFESKLSRALTAWEGQGRKEEYEGKMERIRELDARDGNAWWSSLRQRFTAARRGDGYRATVFPRPSTWLKAGNQTWTQITFKAGEKVDESKLNSEEIKASVHGKQGPFSADIDFSKVDREFTSLFGRKDLAISMEAKRVDIVRPWLDTAVFSNRGWKLNAAAGGNMVISYGSMARNQAQPTSLPLLVTSFILVRNLKLSTNLTQNEQSSFKHSIDLDAKVGIYGWNISGGWHKNDEGHKDRSVVTSTGITCPGMQIVGYVCTVPAACPASSVR